MMGITVAASGSQLCVLDTLHTLLSTTTAGVYVLSLDINALQLNASAPLDFGEALEAYINRKVRTGDTVRQAAHTLFTKGTVLDSIQQSVAMVCPFGADFKIRQPTTTGATGRNVPWSIELLGTPSVKSSGSQLCVLDTLHTIFSSTDAGVYVLSLDIAALEVNTSVSIGYGERLNIFINRKTRTGDTVRQLVTYFHEARAVEGDLISQSIPIVAPFGMDVIIQQPTTTGGSGRSIPWSIEQLDR